MEIIDISGYILEEKIEIARRHLVKKQLKEHGVNGKQVIINKEAIQILIEDYTRESGVRQLEKNIARIIRNRARFIANHEEYNQKIAQKDILKILGPPAFQREKDVVHQVPGVVTGLAWTAVGGEILYIEVSLSKGKGNLTLTGNLGDVMKESATLAFEYLKSHPEIIGLNSEVFEKYNVHLHVPEGATPKDGPSAGITMFTALASAFSQRKAKTKIAMTGEITLRGKVLPVGGIREKILAAKRSNITDLILCIDNKKDIEDIKPIYLKGLHFYYIREMKEVINLALSKEKIKNSINIG
jgi:ATP-dependent Lon protease